MGETGLAARIMLADDRRTSAVFLRPLHGKPYGRAVWETFGSAGANYRSANLHGLLTLLGGRASGKQNRLVGVIVMNRSLVFQHITFDIVDHNGQPWLRGRQIDGALGYKADSVSRIYERNADEFTDTMTSVVKLPTSGGEQEVRIFSLRGAHLLAMLSRTKVAKEFRKWVLDIIEHHTSEPQQPAPTLPQLLTGKRWLVHMTAEGHLIWNEVPPDTVLISMTDMTNAVGKAWWGCVDTLADLNKICTKTGQKFDIPRKAN